MNHLDFRDIFRQTDLPDGRSAVVFNWFPKHKVFDENRNLFLRDRDGAVIWQVHSDHDNDETGPFTTIRYVEGRLEANRWIGMLYEVDLASGYAKVIAITK